MHIAHRTIRDLETTSKSTTERLMQELTTQTRLAELYQRARDDERVTVEEMRASVEKLQIQVVEETSRARAASVAAELTMQKLNEELQS